jgi:hypothetical protein
MKKTYQKPILRKLTDLEYEDLIIVSAIKNNKEKEK